MIDLLAIGAHPDDVEIGCGGTLHKAAQLGWRVVVLDLTRGEMASQGDPETRAREAKAAAAILGLADRINLGLPDTAIGQSPHHLAALTRIIRQQRPRLLLAPWIEDRHPDHATCGRLAERAFFFAGVDQYDAAPAHRPQALYHYMLHHPFAPTFVVDVTASWPVKRRALGVYRSQFEMPEEGAGTSLADASFLAAIAARDTWMGALIGATHGEGFVSRGPLAVAGLERLDWMPSGYSAY